MIWISPIFLASLGLIILSFNIWFKFFAKFDRNISLYTYLDNHDSIIKKIKQKIFLFLVKENYLFSSFSLMSSLMFLYFLQFHNIDIKSKLFFVFSKDSKLLDFINFVTQIDGKNVISNMIKNFLANLVIVTWIKFFLFTIYFIESFFCMLWDRTERIKVVNNTKLLLNKLFMLIAILSLMWVTFFHQIITVKQLISIIAIFIAAILAFTIVAIKKIIQIRKWNKEFSKIEIKQIYSNYNFRNFYIKGTEKNYSLTKQDVKNDKKNHRERIFYNEYMMRINLVSLKTKLLTRILFLIFLSPIIIAIFLIL